MADSSNTAAEVQDLIVNSLTTILAERDEESVPAIDSATQIFGRGAALDSLGLVTLLVDLEQQLEEKYDCAMTLADERAMSQERSPFRTVETLRTHIVERLKQELDRAA